MNPGGRPPVLALGLGALLLLATLGEGGGSAASLLTWHGALVLLIVGTLLAPRPAGKPATMPVERPWIAAALFLGLAALGAMRAPYAYAAFLTGLELAACLAVFRLAAGLGPDLAAWLRWPLGGAAIAQGVLVLWQRLAQGDPRPAGTFLNTNHMAGWMVVAILLALGGWRRETTVASKAFAALAVASAAASVFLSGSRGALLGLAVALAWWLARRWQDFPQRARTAVTVAAALLSLFVGARQVQRLGEPDPFRYQRLRIWKASLGVLLDDPWWGSGPGQFATAAGSHQFADGEGPLQHDRRYRVTHSDLLRVPCEFGLPAAAALFAAAGLAAVGLARRRRRGGAGRATDGALAALLAVAVQSLVDNPSRWPALYLLTCTLLGALLSRPAHETPARMHAGIRAGLAGLLVLFFLVGDVGPTLAHRAFARVPPAHDAALTAPQQRMLAGARALNPLHPSYLRRAAEQAVYGQRELDLAAYAEAREAAERAVRLQPTDSEYEWALARVEAEACLRLFRDRATRERAVNHFERAQSLSPSDPRISIDAGEFLLSAGDPLRARRMAERALRVEPDAVPARLLLAESLLDAGEPDAAAGAAALLAEAGSLAARWADAAGRGRYAREMLTLDSRAATRVERKIEEAGE